ncbi:MAG: ABC transporter permease [Actinomycetes bacterium]
MRGAFRTLPLWALYVFLYLPIVVVVIMSFNASKNPFVWSGFSLKWYPELLRDSEIMAGLRTTLVVAIGCTIISVILGTLLAIALERVLPSRTLDAASIAPAVMPDIVLAIGLLAFYTLISFSLGAVSVMLAHSVFGIAFVAAVVRVRLAGMDNSLEEASRDLGASAARTFRKVTLPGLRPAIIAGALLAFTLSLDEFTVAFFTSSPSDPTLPVVIYSRVRFGVTPQINALATILLLVSFIAVILAQRTSRLSDTLKGGEPT